MYAQLEPVVSKYLTRHAEPTARSVLALSGRMPTYASSAVLVAFDETESCVASLLQQARICQFGPVLLIVVVNEPPSARPEQRKQNRRLLRALRASGSRLAETADGGLSWISSGADPGVDLLIVDACTSNLRLGEGEGVGRARKLGFDAALSLYENGKLSGCYCGSLDADVQVSKNYWDVLCARSVGLLPTHGALLFDYRHTASGEERVDRMMQRVELHFRCYVLGLAHAGSPWAYHALGSAMALSLPHYAMVRGIPNRLAGEDFYMLQKLGRIAPLARVAETLISIQTRTSDRVPFGTGPVLAARLSREREQKTEVGTYAPAAYTRLRSYLDLLNRWVVQEEPPSKAQGALFDAELVSEATALVRRMSGSLAQCKTAQTRRRRLHESFGALATLQFIRRQSELSIPMVSVEEASDCLLDEESMSRVDEAQGVVPGPPEDLGARLHRAWTLERKLCSEVGSARACQIQPLDIYAK